MLVLGGASFLFLMMYLIVRAGFSNQGALNIVGLDPQGVFLAIIAIGAAVYYLGPLYGIAVTLSVMIHEFGHVVAFRIAGHEDARFRLVPLMGGIAISDMAPRTQADDFFITLMGPGICIVPMVAAFILSDLTFQTFPQASQFLWIFAVATGALNFFNLLPFWPLDGGRCLRIVTDAFAPRATTAITLGMSAVCAALAFHLDSIALTIFSLLGIQSLWFGRGLDLDQTRLSIGQGVLSVSAYVMTSAVHFVGGVQMIFWIIA
ncbi:hypothetical protein KIN_01140 [Litoreibacter roseus]|uniref:Peptidase M50 domain-containing protein n=2 Tax=Litoreibacter roseus TaxID=2601869 RepID=A0A6N6JAZ0_9RHOB|nr:hypothetical protein KIN_01140 [Litoreibacter roseus]